MFSHGQILNELIHSVSLILDSYDNLIWNEALSDFNFFIDNLDDCFSYWALICGLDLKKIKIALVALIHGAGVVKFNDLLDNHLDLLSLNLEFYRVITLIRLARRYIDKLSLKIRQLEVMIFEPFWGKCLLIHDGVLTDDPFLRNEILAHLDYRYKYKII